MIQVLSALDTRLAGAIQRIHLPSLGTLGIALVAIIGYAVQNPQQWHDNKLAFVAGVYLAYKLAQSKPVVAEASSASNAVPAASAASEVPPPLPLPTFPDVPTAIPGA